MTIDEIKTGLMKLLVENHYNPATIHFYEREWNKMNLFLLEEYGDAEFNMERGLAYLEKAYNFQTKYDNGTISQQRVQLLRTVHLLEDYRLHGVLTRRYYAFKNPISLNEYYSTIHEKYKAALQVYSNSKATVSHYTTISKVFMDYLTQKSVLSAGEITLEICNGYLKTLAGYSFKTIEQNVCGLRHFLRFLRDEGILQEDIAPELHMPNVSKTAKIPSAWTVDELKQLLQAIDRNGPIGKRDYAMILLACILGFRVSDIKNLRFSNIDWNTKQLSIIQHKTHKSLTLPLPDAVGWAIIDYIKNGRPKYYDSDFVFLKHMPPFDSLSDDNHLSERIHYYMRKAGIRWDRNRHFGFHSLRHSAGTMFLDMEVPLPVITTILGQTDTDVTGIYLKTDLKKLAECVLDPPPMEYNYE